MRELRQNTAFTHKAGPFVDTNGDVVASLDIDRADVLLSKNAGALTQKNDATANAAYDAAGCYLITCDATDANTLGHLKMVIDEAGALPYSCDFMVLSAYEWDRKYAANMQALGGVIAYGTAQSASGAGLVLAASEAFADDVLIGATILVFGSTQGYWQERQITDNALSGDSVAVDDWTVTPSGTITYIILGTAPGSVINPAPVHVETIEPGAINASAVAADAVDEIAAGVLTAAAAVPIAANVKEVNDVTITGDGSGTPFGV